MLGAPDHSSGNLEVIYGYTSKAVSEHLEIPLPNYAYVFMCIFMWRNLSDSKSSTRCPGLFHSLLKPHLHFSVSYSYVPSPPFKNILVDPHCLQNKMQIFWISIQDPLSSFPDLSSSVPPIVTIHSLKFPPASMYVHMSLTFSPSLMHLYMDSSYLSLGWVCPRSRP